MNNLGFKFYKFFTAILLPLNTLTSMLNLFSFYEQSSAVITLALIEFLLLLAMCVFFYKENKVAFMFFFIQFGYSAVLELLAFDGISAITVILKIFLFRIPCTVYMYKRRNIFTPGTWEHEMYSNYLEAKRRKYSPEKVKPDTQAHSQSAGRSCMPPDFEYEGDYVDGLRHGHGVLFFQGEPIYKGEFRHDLISGKGSLIGRYGIVYYTGEFHGRVDREILQQWRRAIYDYAYPPITLPPKKGHIICVILYFDGTFEEIYVEISALNPGYKKYLKKGVLYALGTFPDFGIDTCIYTTQDEWEKKHLERLYEERMCTPPDDISTESIDEEGYSDAKPTQSSCPVANTEKTQKSYTTENTAERTEYHLPRKIKESTILFIILSSTAVLLFGIMFFSSQISHTPNYSDMKSLDYYLSNLTTIDSFIKAIGKPNHKEYMEDIEGCCVLYYDDMQIWLSDNRDDNEQYMSRAILKKDNHTNSIKGFYIGMPRDELKEKMDEMCIDRTYEYTADIFADNEITYKIGEYEQYITLTVDENSVVKIDYYIPV